MKKFSKILSVALLVALVLSLGVTSAFADQTYSITITNAKNGETYTAYKVFDASYSNGNYSYWIDSSSAFYSTVSAFATSENGMTLQRVGDSTRYNVITTDAFTEAKAGALAVELNKVETKPTAAGTVTPTADGAATINVNPDVAGYYFVDTSLGALCALNTTDPTAAVTEKNPTTTVDKKVKEDSDTEQDDDLGDKNDADVGDTVYFTTTVTIQPHQKNIVLHDIMQLDKLAFNYGSVVVTGVDATNYSIYYGAHGDVASTLPNDSDYTGDTFAIAFNNAWTEALASEVTATVTYNAVLTTGAIVGEQTGLAMDAGNDNKTSVTYGDAQRTTWDWTRTYTWGLDIFKYTTDNNVNIPLAGAKFQLKKGDTVLTFTKVSDGAAAVPANTETGTAAVPAKPTVYRYDKSGTVTEFETPASGMIRLEGLDADTYSLVETDAPVGFNKLTAPIAVVIDSNTDSEQGDDNGHQAATVTIKQDTTETETINVLNQSGAELPSTGGIGTTIFYVVGGVLVLAAIILLVTKKRMSE